MSDWWKSPVLQGPENDYGEYDYLIEEIPDNSTEWNKYERRCDECGKEHKLNLVYTNYFRTLDGYDYLDSCECWVCYIKRKIKASFKVIKKKIVRFVDYQRKVHELNKIFKANNRPITKEVKEIIKDMAKREAERR